MRCFLVRGGGIGVTIDFHQHEARRVLGLLQDVEAQHTKFEPAAPRVELRRLPEGLDAFRFDMNMNVNDEHGPQICQNAEMLKPCDMKIDTRAGGAIFALHRTRVFFIMTSTQ